MKPIYELEPGDEAPDFTLPSHLGGEVSLSEELDRAPIVLLFHPLCYTPVCADQVSRLQRERQAFEEAGARVLVISVDSVPSKQSWAEELGGVDIPMLSDFWPHGHVSARYGVLRGEGVSERAAFVVDRDGKIAWKKVFNLSESPDNEEILAAVRSL